MRDPYSILGLKQDADTGEIKAAWRQKAKSLHPDANRDDPDATQKFAEAGKAYEVLKDPAKRTRYDTLRAKAEAQTQSQPRTQSQGQSQGQGQGQTIMQQRQAAREAEERARAAKIKAEAVLAELARAEAEKAKAQKVQAEKVQAEPAKTDKTQAQRAQATGPQVGQAQPGQTDAPGGQAPKGQAPGGSPASGAGADAAHATNPQTGPVHPQAQPQPGKAAGDASGPGAGPAQPGSADTRNSAQNGTHAKTAHQSAEDIVSQIFGASAEAQAAAESLRREGAGEEGSEEARLGGPFDFLNLLVRRFRGGPPPEKAPDIKVDAVVTIEDLITQTAVTAELPDGREVRVALDGGLSEGDTVRLKAQGLKLAGMFRGDVIATIRVKKSDRFRVDGLDIRTVLQVTLENAVLGFDTTVETPTGPSEITIPPWSGSDQVVTLAGQGLPDGEGGRGDLKVELSVILWEKPDEKVTDLMRLMREGLYL